jgi:hypothetical protein
MRASACGCRCSEWASYESTRRTDCVTVRDALSIGWQR